MLPWTRRRRAARPAPPGRRPPASPERSQSELGARAERRLVARGNEQLGRARLAPGGQALRDPLPRADERHLVHERVGHRRGRLALLAAEIELLDLLRLALEPVRAREVVVEVLPARAHAAD